MGSTGGFIRDPANNKIDSMLYIIKAGGNVLDDPQQLKAFLAAFSQLEGQKILVHGGGKIASEIGLQLQITPQYVDGRRITDEATLKLVTMVYGGLINKNLVAQLQQSGCNAIGLTGADGGVMKASKRAVGTVDYGYVGDIHVNGVDGAKLHQLLQAGFVPVLAPLSYDPENGSLLNTNADTIAQETAKALAAFMPVQLIYCFEKAGVLRDVDDPDSVIPVIDAASEAQLKADGILQGGMLPKIDNARSAIKAGVQKVIIGHAAQLKALVAGQSGTQII
jgi:acetylglutamate kinase